jgi:hypothetical protein
LNVYRHHFYGRCPTNGVRVSYSLTIKSNEVIPVEQILAATDSLDDRFHEEIADEMIARFGGTQTLEAEHHGVHIETLRAAPKAQA